MAGVNTTWQREHTGVHTLPLLMWHCMVCKDHRQGDTQG